MQELALGKQATNKLCRFRFWYETAAVNRYSPLLLVLAYFRACEQN